jgi:DNA-binding LytR/AlgR family response regulator
MTRHQEIEPEIAGGVPLPPTDWRLGSCTLLVLQLRSPGCADGKSAGQSTGAHPVGSLSPVLADGPRTLEESAVEPARQLLSNKEVRRILARILNEDGGQVATYADSLVSVGGAKATKIAIRAKGKIIFMEPREVVTIEGQGNYVLFRTSCWSHRLRESVSAIEERLEPYGFVRIHRSTIVNEALVEEIRVSSSGEMFLRVNGIDKEYSVSHKYKNAVRSFASCWI